MHANNGNAQHSDNAQNDYHTQHSRNINNHYNAQHEHNMLNSHNAQNVNIRSNNPLEKNLTLNVCGGCNAKIAAGSLGEILKSIDIFKRSDIIKGFEGNEDAAVIQITDEIGIVFTVDFFPAMVDNPYEFGQIAAANALSDCYAMGAEPVSALNIVCFPAEEDVEILEQILKGGADKVFEAGATLSGGHSIHDSKIKYGLAVIGRLNLKKVWNNNTPRVGDVILITKPIGVSLIMSADIVEEASYDEVEAAKLNMRTLNKYAYEIAREFEISSATDITGFGLLGHLYEMLEGESHADFESGSLNRGSKSAVLYSKQIPILKGAYKAASEFMFTQGGQKNRNHLQDRVEFEFDDFAMEEVLYDPQTSGGLMITTDLQSAQKMVEQMNQEGIGAAIIGEVIEKSEKSIYIK